CRYPLPGSAPLHSPCTSSGLSFRFVALFFSFLFFFLSVSRSLSLSLIRFHTSLSPFTLS
ncbi:hypothetical protein LZ31DRAFT_551101, partial [Colletotrichum somersetense]